MWKDWLTGSVFLFSFTFFFYLFLCLFDDASWSKSGGDVGEVEWFTGVMVTWGCWGVLSSWWMFGTESVALTEVWNLFTAEEKGKKNTSARLFQERCSVKQRRQIRGVMVNRFIGPFQIYFILLLILLDWFIFDINEFLLIAHHNGRFSDSRPRS